MKILFVAFFLLALGVSASAQNPIVGENQLPGTPQSTWDLSGPGSASIQGFTRNSCWSLPLGTLWAMSAYKQTKTIGLERRQMNLKRRLRTFLNNRIVKPGITGWYLVPTVQHVAAIFPHQGDQSYTLPAYPGEMRRHPDSPFPIPPDPFLADYCTTVETYLQSGLDDTITMRRLLLEGAAPIEQLGRILELGVAGGRLIRHLVDLAPQQEIWGVDIWASAILWCKEHLSPPFHFATTLFSPSI